MDAQHIVEFFVEVAGQVRDRVRRDDRWGLSGRRDGQYEFDLSADQVAVSRLVQAGFGVLSEESGVTGADREILVVVDPVDGSTNASVGLPWYATSLCALDADGPLAAVVVNQADGQTWHATRGGGAFRDGLPITRPKPVRLADALVAVSGLPSRHLGWSQFRCYGAAALDICAVAQGTFGAFVDVSVDAHGAWDYMGALLIAAEVGAVVEDLHGRDLICRSHHERRTPLAAADADLLAELRSAVLDVPNHA